MCERHRAAFRLLLALLPRSALWAATELSIYLNSDLRQCVAGLRERYLGLTHATQPFAACRAYKSNADIQQRRYVATQHERKHRAVEHSLSGLSGHVREERA